MGIPIHYEVTILEHHLDTFGHVNHATYLELLEQARWEWMTRGGFGLETIKRTGVGPIVMDLSIRYKREIGLREVVRIQSECIDYRRGIATIKQQMFKAASGDLAALAQLKVCMFDTKERKIVSPPVEWIRVLGVPEA